MPEGILGSAGRPRETGRASGKCLHSSRAPDTGLTFRGKTPIHGDGGEGQQQELVLVRES